MRLQKLLDDGIITKAQWSEHQRQIIEAEEQLRIAKDEATTLKKNIQDTSLGLQLSNSESNDGLSSSIASFKSEIREYTSARIRTKRRAAWKYGRIEVRAKLPRGRGLWPAVWLLPETEKYGGWAASGEIDIVELQGHRPNIVHGTIHYGGQWPENQHSGSTYKLTKGDFSEDFHEFTIEWTEPEIRWYVDGQLYQTINNWSSQDAPHPAPFDQKFHLIINLAVGGKWVGAPSNVTEFPAQMLVDSVKVYQTAEQTAANEL